MRRLTNISAETQYGIDTNIPDIWEINVLAWAVFPCTDSQWEYLVNAYGHFFETVYNIWGSWEVNIWNNLGIGEWVYSTKTGAVLNFKSLIAWAGIQITSTANEITITSTASATQVFEDNFVLTATDISNWYIDLSNSPDTWSMIILTVFWIINYDYSLVANRITFWGTLNVEIWDEIDVTYYF